MPTYSNRIWPILANQKKKRYKQNSNNSVRFQNEEDAWSTSDGWNLEDGYTSTDKSFRDEYPRRADFVGLDSGMFIVVLASKRQVDYSCSPNKRQGFKVKFNTIKRIDCNLFKILHKLGHNENHVNIHYTKNLMI